MKSFKINKVSKIIEEYLASEYGALSINEACIIAKGLLEDKSVHIYKKIKQTRKTNKGSTFREGWQIPDQAPSFYMCLGLSNKTRDIGYYMPTIVSKSGEPKTKYDLTVTAWTGWHIFTCLFSENNFICSQGKLLVKNKKLLQEELSNIEGILSSFQIKPMQFVLQQFYSHYELELIKESTSEELNQWINDLRKFAVKHKGTIDDSMHFPLLAKGLLGNAKTINTRRRMRIEFWRKWNMNRTDIFDFSRQFKMA